MPENEPLPGWHWDTPLPPKAGPHHELVEDLHMPSRDGLSWQSDGGKGS